MLAREQQGYIHRDASEDRLLDSWKTRAGTGNLDEEIGPRRAIVESLGGGESSSRVMRQKRGNLQRDPAIDTVGSVVDRPETIGGLPLVFESQVNKQHLARLAFIQLPADDIIVIAAVLDGVIEDGWVRRETSD